MTVGSLPDSIMKLGWFHERIWNNISNIISNISYFIYKFINSSCYFLLIIHFCDNFMMEEWEN